MLGLRPTLRHFSKMKDMMPAQATVLLGAMLAIPGCASLKTTTTPLDQIAVGDAQFCAVAQDKVAYIGQKLVLRGSYVTDLRHYSMLQATCNGEEVGFSLGYGPARVSLGDPRVRRKCEVACLIVVDAVVTGKLVERDGGVDLDFSEMVLPNDLEQ